ncbi:hypothetical protein ABIA32_003195 [Streptacidiphilus sp. MAP12-20]|uniref:hypothetical protein n=1 Tax=Streptacidiphilus sp. MAP12-20 TaxID=3156299 RepID=UPI003516242F
MRNIPWRRTAVLALLVLIGAIAYVAQAPTPLRALLLAPALFWVPGRSLVAVTGVARTAGRFTAPLCVALSLVSLIFAGLVVNLAVGHVPLSVLPLWLSALLLPLNLLERAPVGSRPRSVARAMRTTAWLSAGLIASATIVWTVHANLPAAPQQPYLSFSLGAPYSTVHGVVPIRAGQTLKIPADVESSQSSDWSQYSVSALVDGRTVPSASALLVRATGPHSADVAVRVPMPSPCLHQIRLVLTQAGKPLRSVDLYVNATAGTGGGGSCARH